MRARTADAAKALAQKYAGANGGDNRRQPTWPLAAQQQPALALAFPNASLAALGLPFPAPRQPHNPPNRRVRTRTHNGVGGAGPVRLPLFRFFVTLCEPVHKPRTLSSIETCGDVRDEEIADGGTAIAVVAAKLMAATTDASSQWRRG